MNESFNITKKVSAPYIRFHCVYDINILTPYSHPTQSSYTVTFFHSDFPPIVIESHYSDNHSHDPRYYKNKTPNFISCILTV